jgi:hypothetical protein
MEYTHGQRSIVRGLDVDVEMDAGDIALKE